MARATKYREKYGMTQRFLPRTVAGWLGIQLAEIAECMDVSRTTLTNHNAKGCTKEMQYALAGLLLERGDVHHAREVLRSTPLSESSNSPT